MNNDKLRKIRGLLAMAEDPGATQEERASFSAKASELMLRYQIEAHHLGDTETDRRKVGRLEIFVATGVYSGSHESLALNIARAMDLQIVKKTGRWDPTTGKKGFVLEIWGLTTDLELVEVLYTSLLLQCLRGIDADRDQMLEDINGSAGKALQWKNSWIKGFARAVRVRLEETRKTVGDETPGNALVLVDNSRLVKDAFKEQYPHLRSGGRSGARTNYSAAAAGRAAGGRADLGGKKVGGNRGALSR